MKLEQPVLVVGAGIAGLAAALSLSMAGFAVEIVERAPKLQEAGAGLQLSPNALRVLKRLGVYEILAQTGVAATGVTLRRAVSGGIVARVPVQSADGTPYLSIHRADLQAALLSAVLAEPRIHLTLGMEAFAVAAKDGHPAVLFRSGATAAHETRSGSVVIAADGVNSAIATALGHGPAEFSGDIAWRMTVAGAAGHPVPGIEAWLGPSRHAVAYPIRGGSETNLVLIARNGRRGSTADDNSTSLPPSTGNIGKMALLDEFARWDRRLLDLVDAAGPASAWPLMTSDRRGQPTAPPPSPPGFLLLGDAAHAMLPYAAQGAAMAIEDGWSIAVALRAATSVAEAFAIYKAERLPRLDKVRRRVAFHRIVYHLPFPASLARDMALTLRSPSALARDLAWLYDWTPPEMPVTADE